MGGLGQGEGSLSELCVGAAGRALHALSIIIMCRTCGA